MTPMVRIAALTNYREEARHLGLNPQQPLTRVGLSLPMLEHPEQPVPITQVVSLLEKSARSGETFGLHIAESRQLACFGGISLLITHQAPLREAIDTIVRYHPLTNESLALYMEQKGKIARLREAIITVMPMWQGLELVLRYMKNLRDSLSRIACLAGYGMPGSYRNNVTECDHGKLKRIIGAITGFTSMKTAYGTIKGIEVMRALRKGQTSSFYYGNPLGEMSGKQSL